MKANYKNYVDVEKWLDENEIEYIKLNPHQYRIMGDVALIDLWPARMTVHIVATEGVDTNEYFRLDYYFNPKQLKNVLDGKHRFDK